MENIREDSGKPVVLKEKGETLVVSNDSATCEKSVLAIHPAKSDVFIDVQSVYDSESSERFCRVWAEVGRAILVRRR